MSVVAAKYVAKYAEIETENETVIVKVIDEAAKNVQIVIELEAAK